jgi:hypothetical protein
MKGGRMDQLLEELYERKCIAQGVLLVWLMAIVGLWYWQVASGVLLTSMVGGGVMLGGAIMEKVWTLRRLSMEQERRKREACRIHSQHS